MTQPTETDWERLDGLRDEDIDLCVLPETALEHLAQAVVREGLTPCCRKNTVTLRIDEDVLERFRALGPAYQTRTNEVLRA